MERISKENGKEIALIGSRNVEWYPGNLEGQMLQEGFVSWVKYYEQITLMKLD